MLGFKDDAICLSGLSGTKLKCDIIGDYYRFWWNITSGGKTQAYKYPTGIIDLHAGTGEIYIEDIGETVLGSAGHVLELKANDPNTQKLRSVLVEENRECFDRLKAVIKRRWPCFKIEEEKDVVVKLSSGIFLLNLGLQDSLTVMQDVNLGNCIYFFDPLRGVEWASIEQVAKKRITTYYQTGTEFIIFLFTSDWFLGRDDFTALPTNNDKSTWCKGERTTVQEADELFGDQKWRDRILCNFDLEIKQKIFIEEYRSRLHKWFRYVLPLPFNPKVNQIFHLIICSNYEAGIKRTRDAYVSITDNPKYLPGNRQAYTIFKTLHPELLEGLKGNQRPEEWKLLWCVIRNHEEGLCDKKCPDLADIKDVESRLAWLKDNNYLEEVSIEQSWTYTPKIYQLKWKEITRKLNIEPPQVLQPISPEQAQTRHFFEILDD